ncbi:Dicer-like protein 1 [Tulasnella sp. UAMH 9824]|nr:Dicer-like protein 1 [Tulasnella sp. UAMH 9824]
MSTSDPQELLPRAYQTEIFERALKGNIVAALATGSGKTLIAALLLRWMASNPSQAGKKIFFLVPKVPLVEQQKNFIVGQTDGLKIGGYIGAMGVDLWDRPKWLKELQEHDVFVMTPAILLRLLTHAYISLKQISLLIVDEAHHVRGNSPEAQIFHHHYHHTDKEYRPKIFGMTASPVWSPKNPHKHIADLERLMDSTIISVQENVAELIHYSPLADVAIIKYVATWQDAPADSLWTEINNYDILKDFIEQEETYISLESRYQHALDHLGVLAADRYLYTYLESRIAAVGLSAQAQSILGDLSKLRNQIQLVRSFLEKHKPRFDIQVAKYDNIVSAKVWELAHLLGKYKSDRLQGIVFVERRDEVKVLAWLLPRLQDSEWISCASIVGHGGASEVASIGMTVKAQEATVREFREGKYQVLFASSVAEEGLDFQYLSLVVMFDVVKNVVSFAQSRGRARKAGSAYYAMLPTNRPDMEAKFRAIVVAEMSNTSLLATKRPDRMDIDDDDDDDGILSDTERRARYVTSKGAILTYSTALVLLAELCALLPTDEYTDSLQPKYSGGFQAMVSLPPALPIPRDALDYIGPPCRKKAEAKRAVAFKAAVALHRFGCFDDYLHPVREPPVGIGEDADGRRVPDARTEKIIEVDSLTAYDNPWKEGAQLWVHPIEIQGRTAAGLLVANQLFVDRLLDGRELGPVRLHHGIQLSFDSEEERIERLHLVANFNGRAIDLSITSKPFDIKNRAAYIVPLDCNSSALVDWDAVRRLANPATCSILWTPQTHLDIEGPILARHRRRHRAMLFKRVRTDLTCLSPPEPIQGHWPEKGYKSYFHFYEEFYPAHKHGNSPLGVTEEDTMLEFIELPKARTVVQRAFVPVREVDRQHTVIAPHHAIILFPLSLYVFQAFNVLPALIRHIMGHIRTQEALKDLHLPPLDQARFVEALTLPLVCAGYDYQRLETLGDSCLKLATTVHVFNRYPHKHEGQLHPLRRNSISNIYLRGRALQRSLQLYLSGERVLDGRLWKPPSADVTYDPRGRPLTKQELPRKALQDCMESTLGVAWLTGGMEMVLKVGTELDLCFGGAVPWPERYARQHRDAPKEVPPALHSLMEKLNYQFNDLWLLMEALTHPSCPAKETPTYNRLEFMGDALVDLFVIKYLFPRFPDAPPGKLTWTRSAAVNNATLASISVKELSLDKYVLHAAPSLAQATLKARAEFEAMPYSAIVARYWSLQPPKVLGDLLEAVIGAVFVDSGFQLEAVWTVLERVMSPMVAELHPNLPLDPTSELMQSLAKRGCTRVRFKKAEVMDSDVREYVVRVLVHETELAEPVPAFTRPLAQAFSCDALQKALEAGAIDLEKLCTCKEDRLNTTDEKQVRKYLGRADDDPEDVPAALERIAADSDDDGAVQSLLALGNLDEISGPPGNEEEQEEGDSA